MIGAILLFIAIILYFKPRYRYLSYFLYLSFMMGGLNLWTDTVTGIKTMDMAVIYTFVISAYLVFAGKWKIPKWPIKKYYIAVLIVIVICVLFSYFHYGLSPYQILQGGRSYLLLFSFPILIKANGTELLKVLKILLFFCVVTSVLYIFQIVLKRPLMPYGHFDFDSATGLPRFYNMPVNLIFFLTLSFLLPKFFKGKTWVYLCGYGLYSGTNFHRYYYSDNPIGFTHAGQDETNWNRCLSLVYSHVAICRCYK